MKTKFKVKKYISIILAVCLVFSLGTTASYAATQEAELELIEEGAAQDASLAEEAPPVTEEQITEQPAVEWDEQAYAAAEAERQAQGLPFIAGEIMVMLDGSSPAAAVQSVAEAAGGAVIQSEALADGSTMARVEISPLHTVAQAVEAFEQMPDVKLVQPNFIYKPDSVAKTKAVSTNDPLLGDQWYMDKINTEYAWSLIDSYAEIVPEKEKVRVAVLDTPLDLYHEDYQESLNKELCVDVTSGHIEPPVQDVRPSEHGVHVAGTIAASTNNGKGVAGMANTTKNNIVELVGVGVFDKMNFGTSFGMCAGLNYAIGIGAEVINMSLSSQPNIPYPEELKIESYLCDAAYRRGIVILAAAGNENTQAPKVPADFSSTIGIIATKNWVDPSDAKADFSNYGTHKDFSAPGVGIINCVPDGYDTMNGTSMATPIVSGVVAMMKYVNPDLNMEDVYKIFKDTATDLYKPGFDIYSGWGEINAGEAVKAAYLATVKPLAVPQGLSAESTSYNSIKLSWKPVEGAKGYNVYKSTQEWEYDETKYKLVANVKSPGFADKDLVAGQKVSYRVMATSDVISPSGLSEIVSLRPVCAAPKNLSVKSASKGGVTLQWSKSAGAVGYYVYRSASKSGNYQYMGKTGNDYYKDTALNGGAKYYYKVFAYNLDTNKKVLKGKTAGPVLANIK